MEKHRLKHNKRDKNVLQMHSRPQNNASIFRARGGVLELGAPLGARACAES